MAAPGVRAEADHGRRRKHAALPARQVQPDPIRVLAAEDAEHPLEVLERARRESVADRGLQVQPMERGQVSSVRPPYQSINGPWGTYARQCRVRGKAR